MISSFLNKSEASKPIPRSLICDLIVRYRDLFKTELTDRELNQISFLNDKLDKNAIEIAVFGMVSKGKTSVLNALFGKKLGETGAINGVTTKTSVYGWEIESFPSKDVVITSAVEIEKPCIRFIDTQGIDEVGGQINGEIALKVAKQSDLILFVIAGDITRLEQEAIAQLQSLYKPILLVFNKIDLYPESDRQAIYEALQNEEMRKSISAKEIILTAAKPKPAKVRLQYSDGQESQEIWEQPKPDVQALKERILSLLNNEGKALLEVNVLRSLLDIQEVVTQRYLQKLQISTAIAALVFMIEAFGLLLSPFIWLDGVISGSLNSLLVFWAIGKYPVQKLYIWLLLIVAIACLSGSLGINNEVTRYFQILWSGLSLYVLFKAIANDIDRSRGYGRFGAKKLIEGIIKSAPHSSILQRLQQLEGMKNLSNFSNFKNSNHDEK
ncbi:MAG: hypothetical protein DCF19_14800 [Pseudanabaena frigida]|uniref:G domain-containing protein n=1 Tax=Pseudanabaena frigida TaxID=945775 RepID=A0A2W4W436_9CYAN|nr:MAG: hypothetical protein DCF19_14800 [Pseudanabaena frigida]